ncbi:hypothetical protein KCP78_10250 [Salmonella enterica subsp. enterica]|nr:hypothetical protein KCP78_10250 [Salmonella enterica subsp. enterica]
MTTPLCVPAKCLIPTTLLSSLSASTANAPCLCAAYGHSGAVLHGTFAQKYADGAPAQAPARFWRAGGSSIF